MEKFRIPHVLSHELHRMGIDHI